MSAPPNTVAPADDGAGDAAGAAPAREPIQLRVRQLTIEYASGGYVVRPIEKLDVDASGGQLVLLLGASGCGKTSLLSVLAGILTPAAGSVEINGIEVTELRGRALNEYRRHQIGVVFQAFNLLPSLTASENVQLPLRAAGMRPRAARARAQELLDQMGLSDRYDHRPGDLSGGQQQRVAIARSLGLNPPVVLADEPTAHLDYVQVEEVVRRLRQLGDRGHLVIIATHDERLTPIADRILNLTPRPAGEEHAPQRVSLDAGEVLFRTGDRGELVFVVEDGEIEIFRERADGTEEHLDTIAGGGYFGELAPLLGLPRAAAARATSRSTLTAYTVHDFRTKIRPGTVGELLAQAEDRS
ncbi:MAG: ATP-binding cassette domain-containing protein [Actinobacteria bacterium]|nr:MAG: ATP-binding cassette domain-containing protein [Actinomycetota bacterium]